LHLSPKEQPFELLKCLHNIVLYFCGFWFTGYISDEKIRELESGVSIYNDPAVLTSPAKFTLLEKRRLADIKHLLSYEDEKLTRRRGELPIFSGLLTITEGKKHQVKRMIKYAGSRILYLKRVAIGSLKLDENLKPGEYRELSAEELSLLKNE
jgi:16S rRNA pseudouridine516 synthase